MIALLASLRKNRRLLRDLVWRDLRARYVGSTMGFFWSVIFPIINLFVYMWVFRLVLKVRFYDTQSKSEVGLLMLAGIMVWQAFAESLSRNTNTLVDNQNLIQKVVFPSEVLPVYLTVSALINMSIGLAVALLGIVWFAYVRPELVQVAALQLTVPPPPRQLGLGLALISLPLLVVLQGGFMLGLGYLLAALNLFLRDVYHLIGVFLTVWMFATPIFYPPHMVREAGYGWIIDFNPMYWLIEAYREVMLYGAWPDWGRIGLFALVSALIFAAGARFFMATKPRFPDLL